MNNKGFTIIELLTSVALFLVITSIASGGFIRALRSQRALFELLSANSNSSLTIEQMTREIRTGYNFCTAGFQCADATDLNGGLNGIEARSVTFINESNQIITYDVSDGAIRRKVGLAAVPQKVTAENVNISNLRFIIQNKATDVSAEPSPDGQTRVTILFSASGRGRDVEAIVFHFQTTVSPRQLDDLQTTQLSVPTP
ncbi:MAG: prepilin-type N-terminal cleavage/methylation domain-containing protein [Candidatus Liptonbacteria bacterium]|nr:prepilin-type N-terminal cleavage/methylation domain-containing protein [Candidatus Liptonbacteria bacterium]